MVPSQIIFLGICILFFVVDSINLQICESQGVQNYKIDSKNYEILCQKGPANKLWLVILNRFDGSENFYNGRTYIQYANFGIGNLNSQFFVSLQFLNKVTSKQEMQLYVSMTSGSDTAWANYSNFRVGDSASKYKLSVGGYTKESTAGDSLYYHNGHKFSTPDQDNDTANYSCSNAWRGAYWYGDCHHSNPLGLYKTKYKGEGVIWASFKDYSISLNKIKFMILPKQYGTSHLCLLSSSSLFILCVNCSQPTAKMISGNDKYCISSCENNFYEDNLMCSLCHPDCATCTGPNNYNCNSCASGKQEFRSSLLKDPKHCVDSCPIGSYQDENGICLCHQNCETCSGPNNYNCNVCTNGKKEDDTSILKDPKHCVDQCPIGSTQNSDGVCTVQHQENLIIAMIFMIGIPLIITLFWRVIKSSHVQQLKQNNELYSSELESNEDQKQDKTSIENHKLSLIFYYYKMQLNKSRFSEFILSVLACSDLTFTALNLDLYFLRELVAILNMTRSLIFYLLNIVIYNSYGSSLSIVNILTSFVLLPLPFIYKCITPKNHRKRRLISQDLENQSPLKTNEENYTNLKLSRRVLRNVLAVLFLFTSIALLLLIILSEVPDLNWLIYVVLIQYGSYVVWSLIWGLVCCLIKKKNSFASIARIPDWRVEMVFQDLSLMSIPIEEENQQVLESAEKIERKLY